MKAKHVIFLVLIFASFGLCAGLIPDATYGPWTCNNGCTAQYPTPDPLTLEFIGEKEWPPEVPIYGYTTNDKVVICTATYCTTYLVTASGGYLGIKRDLIVPGPSGGNGGGGTPGGGGGGSGDGPPIDVPVCEVGGLNDCGTVDVGVPAPA